MGEAAKAGGSSYQTECEQALNEVRSEAGGYMTADEIEEALATDSRLEGCGPEFGFDDVGNGNDDDVYEQDEEGNILVGPPAGVREGDGFNPDECCWEDENGDTFCAPPGAPCPLDENGEPYYGDCDPTEVEYDDATDSCYCPTTGEEVDCPPGFASKKPGQGASQPPGMPFPGLSQVVPRRPKRIMRGTIATRPARRVNPLTAYRGGRPGQQVGPGGPKVPFGSGRGGSRMPNVTPSRSAASRGRGTYQAVAYTRPAKIL